jgi:hypothetical protein
MTGTVGLWAEFLRAGDAGWATAGVTQMNNRVRVVLS